MAPNLPVPSIAALRALRNLQYPRQAHRNCGTKSYTVQTNWSLLPGSLSRHQAQLPRRQPQRSASSTAAPQPQSSYSLPQSLLERRSAYDRALPPLSALRPQYRWLKTFPIFVAVVAVSALALFNYQKVNSPIIAANLYALRTNPAVREILGSEVYFASKWAWIWGHINLVQGRVDVQFGVGGTREKGLCRFKATRQGGRNGPWRTEVWSLTAGGETMDLLEKEKGGIDPMAGATY